MSASLIKSGAAGQQFWKAVVLYSEFESGKHAAQLLDRVAARAGAADGCHRSLYRFDVMEETAVAREALYEARDAQIVLLCARNVDRPPDWLMEWLEMWALTRHVREAVLAAWCHALHTKRLQQAVGGLRALAQQHDLDFICAEDTAGRRRARTGAASNR